MKKTFITISTLVLGLSSQAQNDVMVNKGLFSNRSGTEISSKFDFVNQNTGNVINDGSMYFYGDYTNEGLFSYTTHATTGYVVFEGRNKPTQTLSGSSPSFFYDALFNKQAAHAFDIKNEVENGGTVNLFEGVLFVDKAAGGSFIFLQGAQHMNTSDKSHVDGEVIKVGKESFKYPIGDSGYYRFASISAPTNVADQYTGQYLLEDSDLLYPHKNRTGVIDKINNKEYWVVNKSESTNGSIILTLSWDERTTPEDLITGEAKDLHIVRWDEVQKLWVDEGGVVDLANKTISTPVEVDGFGVFTLANVNDNLILPDDLVIYNGVTPNGDGLNDYFIIDNIQRYPNNSVRIYDRWGVEVFHTTNYDSNGNVFNGYSEARATLDKSKMLPTGTYYYILEYEYVKGGSSQTIRKAGFLHLETNQ